MMHVHGNVAHSITIESLCHESHHYTGMLSREILIVIALYKR